MRCLPLGLLALATSLAAQERPEPRWRIGLGFGGGRFDYETDGSILDDDTGARMFRLLFEGTSDAGIGGGIRFENTVSDDDLFVDRGFPGTEADHNNVFAHFTYRLASPRFAMPVRAGLLFDNLLLNEQASANEVEFRSLGGYLEVAPELVLARDRGLQWSLFGEFGLGFGGTKIDIRGGTPGQPTEFDSVTSFFGIELGLRVRFEQLELGLSYVGRWQSMDDSDLENGFVALPYDADFQGLLLGFAFVF